MAEIGQEVRFKCTPVTERYYSPDTAFGVFVFHTKDNIPEYEKASDTLFTGNRAGTKMSILAGRMQQLYIGTDYEVIATLEYNSKYKSYQYNPKTIISVRPETIEDQRKFISLVATEKRADTILSVYPNIVNEIIEKTDNVDLSKLPGFGKKTYEKLKLNVLNNYVISEVLTLLQPLGVTYNQIKKMLDSEPNPALLRQNLTNNPYKILLKIHGFGFSTVDRISLKLNPELRLTLKRVVAFITYYLKEISNTQGHTWVSYNNLESAVRDNVPDCMDIFYDFIQDYDKNHLLLYIEGDKIGLREFYLYEKNTLDILKNMATYPMLNIPQECIDRGIEKSEQEQGFTLTQEQREVVLQSLTNNVCIITGAAGCGKTTISRAILNIYKEANYSIACCALSAKAAQRITEATGFKASTIHRLLEYKGTKFLRDKDNPLDQDVILVDEASMINSQIFYTIMLALKLGSKIIIAGDNKQLPPIGAGNIFSDLLGKSKVFSVAKLTKVLRQAEKSGILMDATKIRNGQYPIDQPDLKIVHGESKDMTYIFREEKETLRDLALKTFFNCLKNGESLDDISIIVPRKLNCTNSAEEINQLIVAQLFNKKQKHLTFGDKEYYVGAKVMQTDNNYEKNVFNGEVGYITGIYDVNEDGQKLTKFSVEYKMNDEVKKVEYERKDIDQIDLAYACTVHKMQGAGIKTVIIITDTSHYTLLDTCLLYTAITRAKTRCCLMSDTKSFKICMTNNNGRSRQTWLKNMW